VVVHLDLRWRSLVTDECSSDILLAPRIKRSDSGGVGHGRNSQCPLEKQRDYPRILDANRDRCSKSVLTTTLKPATLESAI